MTLRDRTEFDHLVRDALTNLYDVVALETHPLNSIFPKPTEYHGSRGEFLRQQIVKAIEKLRPGDKVAFKGSSEWRPYQILYSRYVEGISLQDLQTKLALSERQLRREHSRALQSLATLLWIQAFPDQPLQTSENQEANIEALENTFRDFKINHEPLNLSELLQGVSRIFEGRARAENAYLILNLPSELPPVLADRIILRQVMIRLLSYALYVRSSGDITVSASVSQGDITLQIRFTADESSLSLAEDQAADLKTALYWIQRMNGQLRENQAASAQDSFASLILSIPRARLPLVMVVDDQAPAVRMYQRYLSGSNIRVIGVQQAEQVLPLARQLHPQVILLDVMMPTMDGWEILQALKADPDIRSIGVIICSVWDEPEMAFSLGAIDFLKKPITQKQLLDTLGRFLK